MLHGIKLKLNKTNKVKDSGVDTGRPCVSETAAVVYVMWRHKCAFRQIISFVTDRKLISSSLIALHTSASKDKISIRQELFLPQLLLVYWIKDMSLT